MTYDEVQALVGQPDAVLDAAVVKIAMLDFTQLRAKLAEEKHWSPEALDEVEDLYRKFLALLVRYPDAKLSPTGPIDDFWHAHILDTGAYQDPLASHHCLLSSPAKLVAQNGEIKVVRKREQPDEVGKLFGW